MSAISPTVGLTVFERHALTELTLTHRPAPRAPAQWTLTDREARRIEAILRRDRDRRIG